ncbi:tyrosine-type recombinase/integrase [Falsirhodobacter sp. 20TX0035]|uniref:tyrosine-type recombinase/integrase n=1 Tax=Falsirhodobacter sp. 20TX0035 TaxID=3022019 RepID=UPI00232A989E|nr:tyrosine-type recombinase/integrase [Falsirhodobacter sp. 20TX0035]MDB6454753.1 tyrosine-type recombinase/integrase [Falsirhodobacter sp. 20TX0035]
MKRGLPAHVYNKKGVLYFQRRGYPTVRIQAEAHTPAFAAEYARLLAGERASYSGPRTFNALIASYVASDRYRRLSLRTVQDYDKVLAWTKEKVGTLPVGSLQRKDVIRARDANRKTLRFANYIVQIWRILMEHAIDIGWRDDNPAKGVSLLKSDADPREAWPQDKIDAFRTVATGRALLIFELCLGTGQRIGDVLKMRWSDIENSGINVQQGKTKAKLWVPLTPRLAGILGATPRIGLTICAWGTAGKATSYRGAADMVLEVRRQIGAEAYDLHGLRYSAAAELAAAGCSDEMIMAITGHKTSAMVARYAGPARQKARATEAQERRK